MLMVAAMWCFGYATFCVETDFVLVVVSCAGPVRYRKIYILSFAANAFSHVTG